MMNTIYCSTQTKQTFTVDKFDYVSKVPIVCFYTLTNYNPPIPPPPNLGILYGGAH